MNEEFKMVIMDGRHLQHAIQIEEAGNGFLQ